MADKELADTFPKEHEGGVFSLVVGVDNGASELKTVFITAEKLFIHTKKRGGVETGFAMGGENFLNFPQTIGSCEALVFFMPEEHVVIAFVIGVEVSGFP